MHLVCGIEPFDLAGMPAINPADTYCILLVTPVIGRERHHRWMCMYVFMYVYASAPVHSELCQQVTSQQGGPYLDHLCRSNAARWQHHHHLIGSYQNKYILLKQLIEREKSIQLYT